MAKEAKTPIKIKEMKKAKSPRSKKLVKSTPKKEAKPVAKKTGTKVKAKTEKTVNSDTSKVDAVATAVEGEKVALKETKPAVVQTARKFNNKPVLAKTTGINISPAKVKNIVSNHVLNKEAAQVLAEIKGARPQTITKTVNGAEVKEVVAGTPVNKLSMETRQYLDFATMEYDKSRRDEYAKLKISKMTADEKQKYSEARSKAKRAFEETHGQFLREPLSEFDLDAFNRSYDAKFYDAYAIKKKADEAACTDDEWKRAVDRVTKLKNRFSTNSRVFLSAFVEYLVKQLTLNGTIQCVAENKKIIQLSHILDTAHTDNNERFSLYPLIVNLDTFKQAKQHLHSLNNQPADDEEDEDPNAEEKTVEENVAAKAEKKKAAKCTDLFALDGLSLEKQYQFRYYIAEACRETRMDLAKSEKDAWGNPMNIYNYTSVSKVFKNFCSTLVCEFLIRIGTMLKKEIETRGIKTVNDTIVGTVISHYHTVCGVPEGPTLQFIREVTTKYYGYVSDRQERRKKEKADGGGLVAPKVPVAAVSTVGGVPGDLPYTE